MRTLSRILTLLVFISGCHPGESAVVLPANQAILSSDKLDLGEIRFDREYAARFVLVNPTSKPLSVTSFTASCGCMVPEYDPSPIAPGAQRELVLRISTASFSFAGPVSKKGYVKLSNDQDLELHLEAHLSPDFELSSSRLMFSPDQQSHELTVRRTQATPEEFQEYDLTAEPQAFQVTTLERTSDLIRYRVDLAAKTATSSLPDLSLHQKSDPRRPLRTSTVNCRRKGPELKPSAFVTVVNNETSLQQGKPQRFVLHSYLADPSEIVDVTIDDPLTKDFLAIDFSREADPTTFGLSLKSIPENQITSPTVTVHYISTKSGASGQLLLPCHIVHPRSAGDGVEPVKTAALPE